MAKATPNREVREERAMVVGLLALLPLALEEVPVFEGPDAPVLDPPEWVELWVEEGWTEVLTVGRPV